MLAGSIANNKLTNSAVTIAGNNISLGGSIDATTLRESLGLSNAMHFVGIATVAITDGSTTDPSIGGYTTKQKGDVIIDKDSAYEYVWTGTKWERLGGDGSYKTVQTAVDDPTASGNSSTFIKTISQNENGVITATKATIANHVIQVNGTAAGTYNGGAAVTLNLKDGNGITVTNSSGAITFAHSNSVTAKTTYGSTTTTASANGGSITVTDVKYDAQGHITGSTDRTITLSQTTYTMAGLMGSTAKGSATLPVYWNGKAWAAITSYGGKASTAGTADKVAKGLLINGKSFDGSAAIDVGTLGISYGGTGATTASAALTNLGAAAASHEHGMITSDGKLANQSNKVMVAGADGSITAYGGTAVRSMIGAEAANTCLPLAGGTMTGNIDWGNAKYYGLRWTTNNGTVIALRPYSPSNVFQLTMRPSGGTEFGAFNVYTDGKASFSSELTAGGYIKGVRFRAEADNDYPTYEFKANSQTNYGVMIQMGSTNMLGIFQYPKEFDGQSTRYYEGYRLPEPSTGLTANKNYKILTDKVPVTVAQGGTGATTVDAACANIGALRYKQYEKGYIETGASNTSAWLTYFVDGTQKCQIDLTNGGKLAVNQKAVLVSGDVIPYMKYNTNSLSVDSWIDNNAYTLALRDDGTDKCVLVMWNGGALTVNGSIVATEARDNTFAGTLTVSNTKSAGGYVKIWEDNEGGNIAIGSKSGKEFQMDAYNDTTWRLFAYDNSNNIKSITFNRTNGNFAAAGTFTGTYYTAQRASGDVYFDARRTDTDQRICFGIGSSGENRGIYDMKHNRWVFKVSNTGVDLSAMGIIYSSTQPTAPWTGAIWLKPV